MDLPKVDIDPDTITTLEVAKPVITQLLNIVEQQHRLILTQDGRIQELRKEIDRLKGQPSRPGFRSPPTSRHYSASKHLKQKSGPHKGKKMAKQIPVDREEILPEINVCDCGGTTFISLRTWNKLVQGLIIKRDNALYRGRDIQCADCGKVHHSPLPSGVSGYQFSPELRSWLSVFKYDCRMSETVISRFLSGIGVVISDSHINQIILENSTKLSVGYTHLRVWGLKLSHYLHSDATMCIRQMVKTGRRLRHHLQFLGHQYLSLFKITTKYNSSSLANQVLGKRAMKTIYISDDGSPNGEKLSILFKQLCWIHEIRHYTRLIPTITLHRQQLHQILDQLWQLYHQAKEYNLAPTIRKRMEIETLFDQITSQTVDYDDLTVRLKLTRRKRSRLLCFLDHPGIPIENNLAERDLRPAVIMRKISGGTKSVEGDKSFERHLSIIQTAHKQDLNVFDTIHGLLMGTLDPFLLTAKTQPALTPIA